VDAAVMREEVLRRRGQRRMVGDVEGIDAMALGIRQARAQGFEHFAAPCDQAQGRAFLGIAARQRFAYAARCPGQENALHDQFGADSATSLLITCSAAAKYSDSGLSHRLSPAIDGEVS